MQIVFVPGFVPVVDVGISAASGPARRFVYPLGNEKVLLRFEIWRYLSRSSHVDLAELVLPAPRYNGKGGTITVFPVLHPWAVAETTWTERLAGTPWSAPGCLAGVDYGAPITVSQDSSISEFRVDVTASVREWRDRAAPNNGWLITGNVWIDGASNPSPSRRPSLLMRYSTKRSRSRVAVNGISHGDL